jgi:HAMP domain-containing protein
LIVLVFSNWDEATQTLPALQDDIASTTKDVTTFICILCAALWCCILIAAISLVTWLTAPLERIGSICSEIIQIAAEDELKRDYSAVVLDSHTLTTRRTDEIGILAANFGHMVMYLHNATVSKKHKSKNMVNPLYFANPESWNMRNDSLLTIYDLFQAMRPSSNVALVEAPSAPALPTDALSTIRFSAVPLGDPEENHEMRHGKARVQPMEIDSTFSKSGQSGGKVALATEVAGNYSQVTVAEALPVVPRPLVTVTAYLSALGTLLLVALVAIMIVTIVTLQREGYNWMSDTTSSITAQEMTNLMTVTNAKAVFMKVWINKLYSITPNLSITGLFRAGVVRHAGRISRSNGTFEWQSNRQQLLLGIKKPPQLLFRCHKLLLKSFN